MPRKRLRQGHSSIPDHLEFNFLHDYPQLTAEQQKELSAVVTLLEAWEQSRDDTSRQDEAAAYFAFQQSLIQFKLKHGLDKIPADHIAAMRVLCVQEETVINMLEGQPRVDFERRIDSLRDQWRGRSHALGTPPVKRVIANATNALDAIDDLRRQLDTLPLRPQALRVTEQTVYVNGKPVPLDLSPEKKEDALAFLAELAKEPGNWMSSTDIGKATDHEGVRFDRVYKALPPILKRLLESDRRKGYRMKWRK